MSLSPRLYISNLPKKVTEESVRELFSAEGRRVVEVSIMTDRRTGESHGYAFVEMGSPSEAQAAIHSLDGHVVDGQAIRVSEARARPGH